MTVETKVLILIVFALVVFSVCSRAEVPPPVRQDDVCDLYGRRMADIACRDKDNDCIVIVYLQFYFNCAKSLDK